MDTASPPAGIARVGACRGAPAKISTGPCARVTTIRSCVTIVMLDKAILFIVAAGAYILPMIADAGIT
jgi:hypothetical protein